MHYVLKCDGGYLGGGFKKLKLVGDKKEAIVMNEIMREEVELNLPHYQMSYDGSKSGYENPEWILVDV